MVATDTLVGIVGAVVLFAVMAGVFVYEYNNTPETSGGNGDGNGGNLSFAEQYPFLDASQDIDGDGLVNGNDTDVDGDGTPNANDNETIVTKDVGSGTLGPQAGPVTDAESYEFTVGNGSSHVMATVTISLAASTAPVTGTFQVELRDPSGAVIDTQSTSAPFNQRTLTVQSPMDQDVDPGAWTVRITQNTAGPGGSVAASAKVHYGDHVM